MMNEKIKIEKEKKSKKKSSVIKSPTDAIHEDFISARTTDS